MRDEETIFTEALRKQTPQERSAYLDEVCASDPHLREAVEALLAVHERADGILESPPLAVTADTAAPPVEQAGAVIGHYKLLEQIGEGGMGTVFMAEQLRPVRRRVALKIIKPGLDTKQVIARFEAERQALAMMDHPCIAKVFDAGITDAGRSYFVMELVRGIPLTEYCDKHQLNPRQRLELFVQVCSAVQHAHQKGIIHRDLKPSNVLVTLNDGPSTLLGPGKPTPKIIDFGIAKATGGQQLTDRTLFTHFSQLIGTPIYMSPEQAEMSALLDVDTRSDVYSLGVLMYELLTGTTPFDKKRLASAAYDEVRRIIREEEPPRPSTRLSTLGDTLASISAQRQIDPKRLGNLVRGELDWIVMKALEKDRTRRYETANSLARDVERYLTDQPVEACPPSRMYRFRKLVRRNKAALVMGPTIAAVLVVATAVSSWQAIRATRAERTAVVERETAVEERTKAQTAQGLAAERGDDLRRHLYASQMIAAGQAAELPSGITRVKELIERWRHDEPDLRGWEWYYLNALSHPELMTLSESNAQVRVVQWSPDGTRLASGDLDGIVRIWEAASGKVLYKFPGHAGNAVSHLAWSGNGSRLATSSDDGVVRIWNPANGIESFTHRQSTRGVIPVAWTPDGKTLAVGQGNLIVLRNGADGAEIRTLRGHSGWITCLAWSRDGTRLASGSRDTSVRLWDPDSGDAIPVVRAHTAEVTAVSWHPDGTRLASASRSGWIRIFDTTAGKVAAEFTAHGSAGVQAVAWDPLGQRLLTAGVSDRSLTVWEATKNTELFSLSGHTAPIAFASWSPDGTRIASASGDGTVRIWSAAVPRHARVVGRHGDTVRVGAFVWRADSKQVISAGGAALKVLDVVHDQELASFRASSATIRALALDPDGGRLAVGDNSGRLRILDSASGQELKQFPAHNSWLLSAAWHPNGRWLATAGAEGMLIIWDLETEKPVFTSAQEATQLRQVAWSPDGTRLASATGTTIIIRSVAELDRVRIVGRHTDNVWGLAWKPDGTQLASACLDGTVKIWNSTGGEAIQTLLGHTDEALAVAWSPDGTRLASASRDKTIRIWNTVTGQEMLCHRTVGSNSPSSPTWSPDGMKLVYGVGNVVWMLDATIGYSVVPFAVPTSRPSSGELVQQQLREYLALQGAYREADHPEVVATIDKLAASLQASGKFVDAEPLFRDVVKQRRKALGDAHLETRNAVRELAGLVLAQLKQASAPPATHEAQQAVTAEREGLSLMRRIESEYADSPELLASFYLGLIGPLMDLGRIDDAKMLSRKVTGLTFGDTQALTLVNNPGNAAPRRQFTSNSAALGEIAERFAASDKPAERDISLAVELAQMASRIAPTLEESWFTLGLVRYHAGDFQRAVADLEKAPSIIEGFFLRAMAHHQLGDKDLARAWYTLGCQWTDRASQRFSQPEVNKARVQAAALLGLPEKWPAAGWTPTDAELRLYRGFSELEPGDPRKVLILPLVEFYESSGKPDEAKAWRAKLPTTWPTTQPAPTPSSE